MAGALVVIFAIALWQPGRSEVVRGIAFRAWRAGSATRTCSRSFPRSLGMLLTDPAAVIAKCASHSVSPQSASDPWCHPLWSIVASSGWPAILT
jgi:hypothetical protein